MKSQAKSFWKMEMTLDNTLLLAGLLMCQPEFYSRHQEKKKKREGFLIFACDISCSSGKPSVTMAVKKIKHLLLAQHYQHLRKILEILYPLNLLFSEEKIKKVKLYGLLKNLLN